jgi:hypothetical protein
MLLQTTHPSTTMPTMHDTPLTIKQTLDVDPEINFINWELNVQDVAATTGRTIAGAQGLLGLVLNTAQWDSHALNISVNVEGHQVIAQRYAAPAYVELDVDMSATEITITKTRNKTREDWIIAEQSLKRTMMDSLGLAIRHIIDPSPLCFQNMTPIDIIDAVRIHYGKTTTRTVRRLDEILAEKLDNVRNFKTHAAKMQNAFSIGTASGIPMNEITRTKLLRTSILGHHVKDKLVEGYDHDYPDFLQQTFNGLCDYLNMHLPNAESREADTKAHGLSVKGRSEDDILLSMNAEQITAYLAATNDTKKWKSKLNKQQKESKRQQSSTTSNSDDESEQPTKRPRVEHYSYCDRTQYTHNSAECKVMQADKKRFTSDMRNATDSQYPPGGSNIKPRAPQVR